MLFAKVFVTTVVVMDPIGNVPVFLALTARGPDRGSPAAARDAALTAGAVIFAFAAFGGAVLDLLGISVQALEVSGGLLLVLVALELLGATRSPAATNAALGSNVALVPLGTPLLAGPGAIAATMVYVRDAANATEVVIVIGALVAVLVVVYAALRSAPWIEQRLHDNGIALLSRIVGLLLAAIAVQLVATGVQEWIRAGV